MDFIDDFIQEYKNHDCLWKADSVDFKNRTKRQEAYMQLINVAAKHGEHYNIERTKQKINNLRCAFRHQLKKYTESKTKGVKDEQYCPKRRYFESLMFLKDEEFPDRKQTKREVVKTPRSARSKPLVLKTEILENVFTTKDQSADTLSDGNDSTELCRNNLTELITNKHNHNLIVSNKPTIISNDRLVNASTLECDEEQSIILHGTIEQASDEIKDEIVSDMFEIESAPIPTSDAAMTPRHQPKQNHCRKRSSSISSQQTNGDAELNNSKSLKIDFNALDFEKLFAMACKAMHSSIDDHFMNFGKVVAHKLRQMDQTQAIYAERIVADVLFQGHMKMLTPVHVHQLFNIEYGNTFSEANANK